MTDSSPDFAVFCQRVLKDIRYGGQPIQLALIQLSWIAHINYCWDRNLDALILAPMGHGKSTIVAVGLPLYLLGTNPNCRVKIISATDNLAKDRVGMIRQYIVSDNDYREVFPNAQPAHSEMWTQGKIYLKRDGRSPDASLESKGVLATGAGGRCDVLILDDPSDRKNSYSDTTRRSVIDSYNLTWRTRLEPWGRTVMIATPYHREDLIHAMKDRNSTCTLTQSVSADYAGVDFNITNAPDDNHPLLNFAQA